MEHKSIKRFLSAVMAFVMLLSLLPLGSLNVFAEETTTVWDFSSADFIASTGNSYNGLTWTNGKSHNDTYLYSGAGTISVPVSGPSDIAVSACYEYSFYFESETEASVGKSTGSTSQIDTYGYSYNGEAGTVDITVLGGSYLTKIEVTPKAVIEVPEYDSSIVDVWDFGAEQLDSSKYNNMLTVDEINSWFPDYEPGTTGVANGGFVSSDGQLEFNGGGKVNHRLRSTNAELTRYDDKSLTDANGNTYTGYIYSNAGSNTGVYVGVTLYAGDKVTYAIGSNGGSSTICFEGPNGVEAQQVFDAAGAKIQLMEFYPSQTGVYKVYSTDEKLVVARIYREHSDAVAVTGAVSAPAELTGYSLVFTNQLSGATVEVPVSGGAYSATLFEGYTYDLSLKNANGYVIVSEQTLTVADGAESVSADVTVAQVDLVTVTGSINGLSEEALAKAQLAFNADAVYIPAINVSGNTYTAVLEKGVSYEVVVSGVNDYAMTSPATVSYDADATADITLEAKPTYAVTIVPTGATLADLASATFTFTNLNEEGYVYTFTGTEGIALRDGVYSVKVTNSGAYVQQLTANVQVSGAAVTRTIPFSSDISVWDFSAEDFTGENGTYNNLTWTNASKNKTYLLAKDGTVSVPVSGPCQIVVSACYEYSFYFASEDEASVGQKTGSTSQIDSFTYSYNGGAGTVDITVLGTSYLTKIEVLKVAEFKDTLTVGASGCDFTTIAAALDAVASMDRPNNERVTILIQPGNYEEMLVINTPNVTLKNASSNPSIELTNKGVDIAANAVRITHYYGCGYNYFSMNSSCKYDENVLAVNKENGYTDFVNPGDGSGSDSYWNATVIVKASGFQAEGIIFENSFNQYVSEKAANDVIVPNSECKEGSVTRGDLPVGSTAVQDKAYVERAAALAIIDGVKEVYFENCKFVGRQDTLYGGKNSTVAFYDCSIYGACDYIFGGMTAVFAKCDLVFNTSENNNDVGYITAAQTPADTRGMLMYNCTVTSTVPGVDTASEYTSKPGYLGRPWAANTGEAVFYNTVIEATDSYWYNQSPSLILPAAWLSSLSGESKMCGEFGTYEMALNVDNSASRASWASKFEGEVLSDGSPITVETFLGSWDPFAGKDMTIVIPTEKVDNKPVEEEDPSEGETTEPAEYNFDSLVDVTPGADKDAIAAGTTYADGYFKVVGSVTQRWQESKGGVYAIEIGKNGTGAIEFMVSGKADVTITVASTGGSNTSAVAIVDAEGNVIANNEAITEVTGTGSTKLTYTGLEAGTYQIVSPQSDYNRGFRLMTINVVDTPAVVINEYTFDSLVDVTPGADKDAIAAGTVYADGYFKVVGSVTQRWQESKGGVYAIEIAKNGTGAVEFTVVGSADVTITVASTGGSNTSTVAIIDAQGNVIANNEAITEVTGTGSTTLTYTGLAAGTYQIVSPQSDYNRGFRLMTINVVQTSSGERPARLDWAQVADPVIIEAVQNGGSIDVKYEMVIGYDGADSVTITLTDGAGNVIGTASSADTGNGGSVSFKPTASGSYAVYITASRLDETDKVGTGVAVEDFLLPLAVPGIASATSIGGGAINVVWSTVAEADSYHLYMDGTLVAIVSANEYTVAGLTVGTAYSFTVAAVRGEEVTAQSAAVVATATEGAQRVWGFTTYGSSTSTSSNGYIGSVVDDGQVTVYSEGGKGKIVPNSTDGVAFYYTEIPTEENFTLRANVHVDSWTLSNGQEGFGLLATDRLGPNGSSASFWNNQYMAAISKNEYRYDKETDTYYSTSSSLGQKYSMKLGVMSIAKTGVTPENLEDLNNSVTDVINNQFSSVSNTLERYATLEADITNIVGNATTAVDGTSANPIVDFVLEIQKNNTGYFVTYYDMDGNIIRQVKDYDPDALSKLDAETVYVGFFAARNARATFSNIELTTILASEDAPAEERPVNYIVPEINITSGSTANSSNYTAYLYSNVAGTADLYMGSELVAEKLPLAAGTRYDYALELPGEGTYKFTVKFTPDPDQDLGEFNELSSTDTIENFLVVSYVTKYQNLKNLYVSPAGKPTAAGTYRDPLDIYTAVKYVQPGQKIILLAGTYAMTQDLKIEHGVDGTADEPIYMIADPNASSRPVLDFQKTASGMTHGGDYWYFQGFDVTNSAPGQKGFQVSGHYNTLDQINAYNNGNTGIQISRYAGSDPQSEWPSYNLILNCTAYNNADPGYEDADGFAAKLTCGEGNKFYGCVAYNNADDGWDLYAKVESGPIGSVTIENCVAYQNGYVIENGVLVNAGNGNGFKMGGESISGKHKLINSIAFNNKAKGIDSNSCPDIIVENSISYNNQSHNVAFYTNNAANTDFSATGIISFKDSSIKGGLDVAENLKPKGSQDESKYTGSTNYYWNGTKSVNSANVEVTADWFVSLEFKGILRNADGTIDMQGFLELTDAAPADAGARLDGSTASPDVEIELDNPFTDVGDGNQFKDYILWGYYNGIINGKTATTFEPENTVTRGQFLLMLWQAAGSPEPTEYKSFPDVSENSRFYKAVCWAVEKNITNGQKDGTFGVNDPCTRGHVVLFLYRYAGQPEVNGNVSFPDVTGGTYYDAVRWAAEQGITNGQSDGNFGVGNACKRMHVMKFLYLFLN